ncbi:DUF167 family protein [uncultured Roseibium sp.]|uniref:DUF167 family protein n=1 Tax=uncultured Roseibium sp. TaxID=1936171 RepID=UPI0032163DA8
MSAGHPWRPSGDGLLVDVRLTPKSSKDGIDGIDHLADGRCVLKARVRAVPEKGAANVALIKLVAKAVGLPKSAVDLESGSTSRIKTLRLSGDADRLSTALGEICSE